MNKKFLVLPLFALAFFIAPPVSHAAVTFTAVSGGGGTGAYYSASAPIYTGHIDNCDYWDGQCESYTGPLPLVGSCAQAATSAGLSDNTAYWCIQETWIAGYGAGACIQNISPTICAEHANAVFLGGSGNQVEIFTSQPTGTQSGANPYFDCGTHSPVNIHQQYGANFPTTGCQLFQYIPPPSPTLVANPSSILSGNSSALTWTVSNASSCSIDNGVGAVSASGGSTAVSPGASTTYTITCTGTGGTGTASATVTVTQPAPTATLTVVPTSITSGNSATLSYACTNSTSASIDNGVGAVTLPSGTKSVSPTVTTTYTLTCSGPGGSATNPATLTVTAASAPTVNLTANPTSIVQGNSSTLSWTSTNATSCSAAFTGNTSTSGSQSVSPSSSTTYSITCTGAGGSASDTATVMVTAPVPTASLSASPTTITQGDTSTLTYACTNSTSASINNGVGVVTPTSGGTAPVSPTVTTTYTLTCSGAGGTATANATVAVNGIADLTVTAAPTPSTATINTPVTFSGTVQNIGSAATTNSFPNIIEINTANNVVQTNNLNLAAGGSGTASAPYTFTSPGTYQVRLCANTDSTWTNSVTESNYGNNCGPWQAVTVSASSLQASCGVTPTSSFINQNVTWASSVSGGITPYTYTWGGSVSGSGSSAQQSYTSAGTYGGQVTVHSSDGQQVVATCSAGANGGGTVTVTSCAPTLSANPSTVVAGNRSTLTWSEPAACDAQNSCTFSDGHVGGLSGTYIVTPPTPSSGNIDTYAITCPASIPSQTAQTNITVLSPNDTLTANPNRVPVNSKTTVTWTSTDATTCTITRNGQAWGPGTGTSGSVQDTITAQTIYSMTCDTIPTAVKAIVNVLPAFQEF